MLPLGFQFAGISCGLKASELLDLALITTDAPSVLAGVYTQNVVRAASIDWNRDLTPSDSFRALIINSGNANACTGEQGKSDNEQIAVRLAEQMDIRPTQVSVLSTGVIGHLLPMEKLGQGIQNIVSRQSNNRTDFDLAAKAILTTDKGPKTMETSFSLGDEEIRIAGIAKGAGMIGPNMATMLAVIMCDAVISPSDAQRILLSSANQSFNRISVEGHTSTNDALLLICSGQSGTQVHTESDLEIFQSEITKSCIELAKKIPSDGEGASHLICIHVSGAESDQDADAVARTIASSQLVKTAITGADPNWGRIVSAAGYSRAAMNLEKTDLKINGQPVFRNGQPVEFDAALVSRLIAENFETGIELKIGSGHGQATHWTSDLTVDYVRFNSEYHT